MNEFSPVKYLLTQILLFMAAGAAFVYVIISINPFNASLYHFIFFYSSLFLATYALFSLLGYILRVRFTVNSPLQQFAQVSKRQGSLFALLLIIFLFLQSVQALTILSIILLLVSFTLLELAFLSK